MFHAIVEEQTFIKTQNRAPDGIKPILNCFLRQVFCNIKIRCDQMRSS